MRVSALGVHKAGGHFPMTWKGKRFGHRAPNLLEKIYGMALPDLRLVGPHLTIEATSPLLRTPLKKALWNNRCQHSLALACSPLSCPATFLPSLILRLNLQGHRSNWASPNDNTASHKGWNRTAATFLLDLLRERPLGLASPWALLVGWNQVITLNVSFLNLR